MYGAPFLLFHSPLEKTPHKARVVGDGLISAPLASVAMPAEGSGAAALNGPKGFELLKAKARPIPIQEAITMRTQNVGTPRGWAESFLFFSLKATTDALGASES